MCCVRPGFLEAKASCFCCVSVLMHEDLPALERPTKAISGTSTVGNWCSWAAVVRKRAVCIQPIALLASAVGGKVPTLCAGSETVMKGAGGVGAAL